LIRVWGRVRNIVDYGAFIDLGYVDGLLHLSGIPGALNGMIGEELIKRDTWVSPRPVNPSSANVEIPIALNSLGITQETTMVIQRAP
jgi:hypothetical protein